MKTLRKQISQEIRQKDFTWYEISRDEQSIVSCVPVLFAAILIRFIDHSPNEVKCQNQKLKQKKHSSQTPIASLGMTVKAFGLPIFTYSDHSSPKRCEPSTPNNRLKFLCSFGGKIIPCPTDGRLKYIGGDNRVLAVPRTVSFADLKNKIYGMFHVNLVIKYQFAQAEELNVLISVTSDDDLAYMIDEYDHLEALNPSLLSSTSHPRFRLYLFPYSSPATAPAILALSLDAAAFDSFCLNSDMPTSPSAKQSVYTASPLSTSPTATADGPASLQKYWTSTAATATCGGGRGMHRVTSTPNLGCSAGGCAVVSSATNIGAKGGDMIKHNHHQHQHLNQIHGQHNSTLGGSSSRLMAVAVAPGQPVQGGHYYSPLAPPRPGSGGCAFSSGNVEEPYSGHQTRCSPPGSPKTRVSCGSSPLGARTPF